MFISKYMYLFLSLPLPSSLFPPPPSGSVDVYSVDDNTGSWTLSHSLKFTKQQFPGMHLKLVFWQIHCTCVSRFFFRQDQSSYFNLSLSLSLSEASLLLGPVQCLEWSYSDASVIAVSWKSGGLSLWSVFGSLLLCSLGDQPG